MADPVDGDSAGPELPEPTPLNVLARAGRAHGGDVRAVAIIRGDSGGVGGFLSGGDDGMLRTWNLDLTPRATATELAHSGGVRTVAAIPGEDRPSDGYLSGGNDGILRTWNLDLTPRDTAEPTSGGGVFSVAVITGPGGMATGYLSGGNDGILRTWNLDLTPRGTSIGPKPGGGVFSVAVITGAGGEATGYLSGGYDGILRTWNLDLTPRGAATTPASGGRVSSVAVIAGQGAAATGYVSGGDAGVIRTWNLDLTPEDTSPEPDPDSNIESVAVMYGPDGRPNLFVSGADDGTVRTWNPDLTLRETTRPSRWVWSVMVILSPQGQANGYVSGGDDGKLRTWNLDLTPRNSTREPAHGGTVMATEVITGPGGSTTGYLTGGEDGLLRTWNLDLTPRDTTEDAHRGPMLAASAITGPEGTTTGFVAGGESGWLGTWNLDLTPRSTSEVAHRGAVITVSAIKEPGGTTTGYITGGGDGDGMLRTWNLDLTPRDTTTEPAHRGSVLSIAVITGPDGTTSGYVSGGVDGALRTWNTNLTPGHPTRLAHQGGVSVVAALKGPEGTTGYLSGGLDGTLRTWNTDLTPRGTTEPHGGGVTSVAVLTGFDGPIGYVCGDQDGTVRTWDLDLNPWAVVEPIHQSGVSSLTVITGPDGDSTGCLVGWQDGELAVFTDVEGTDPLGVAPTLTVDGRDGAAPATRYETVNTRDPISTADSVSVEDLIGRGPLVDHLVGVVEQLIQSTQDSSTQRGSCVIRIDAPWGSGKSTLLGLLEQGLKQRRAKVGEPIVVRFDAWRESQVGPEWWSLGGALYRGIKSERVLATRAAMAVSSAIDRVVRSKVVIGALVILAILAIAISWGPVAALATRWQLVLTTLTGVVAAAFALSRILFWSSPALGQLHQKADDAPLAEVARMVSKYRRWAPRQDTAHKLADTLLGTWLVLIALWATHHAFTDVRTRGLDAVASSLVIAAIGLGGVFLLTVAAKPAQPSPESPTSPAWQRVPYLLAALILGALFVGFSGLGSVLGGEFRDWARDLGDLDTRRWVVTAVLLLIAGLAIYITWLRRTIGSPRRPTLLAIDDLDRCTHEKTVAYLETIHTLIRHHAAPTSFPRWREPGALVVIVLADGRWVREAFSTQYDAFKDLGDPGVRSLGADFITKLFDHTVLIPELNEDQVKRYLDSLSKSQPLPDPEPIMSDPVPAPPDQDVAIAPPPEEPDAPTPSADPAVELTDVLESVSSSQAPDELRTVSDRAATLPPLEQATAQAAIQDLRGSEQYVVELQRHLITAYSHVMPRNPRLIRRVANTWAMLEALQASIGIQGDEADLVHAAIFFVRYPTLVDTLLHSAAPPSGQDDVWIRADVLATRTQASGDVMSPEELAACYGKEFLAATPRQ